MDEGRAQAWQRAARANRRATPIAFALLVFLTGACLLASVLLLRASDDDLLFELALPAGALGALLPALARAASLLGRRPRPTDPALPWVVSATLLALPLLGAGAGLALALLARDVLSALSSSPSRLFFAGFLAGIVAGVWTGSRMMVVTVDAPMRES